MRAKLTGLQIPPIARSSARLISRFDAYAIIVFWRDVVRVGPLTPVDIGSGDRVKAIPTLTRDVLTAMAVMTEETVGVPVTQSSNEALE